MGYINSLINIVHQLYDPIKFIHLWQCTVVSQALIMEMKTTLSIIKIVAAGAVKVVAEDPMTTRQSHITHPKRLSLPFALDSWPVIYNLISRLTSRRVVCPRETKLLKDPIEIMANGINQKKQLRQKSKTFIIAKLRHQNKNKNFPACSNVVARVSRHAWGG